MMATIENLKIVIFGNFMVIGKMEGRFLHRPRTVHIEPNKQGQMLLMLNPMVGTPDKIEIHNIQASYPVDDAELERLYIQVTTGLAIAKNVGSQN